MMDMSKQFHFVLVHGGGHGAWCWWKIVSALEEYGHRVTTLDLNSAGDSHIQPDDITSFEEYNQPLEDFFRKLPENEKVVLVGHSLGGFSLTAMLELFPQKIKVAVYVCARMLASGASLLELFDGNPSLKAASASLEFNFNYKVAGGPPTSQRTSKKTLEECLYNKCSPEDLAFALERVRPFPFIGTLATPIIWTAENYGSVPRVFIIAEHDKCNLPASCRLMIELNPVNEVFVIDGADHSVFFSAPGKLTQILLVSAMAYDS